MKIFRTILDVENLGTFLIQAEHENAKVLSLTAFPIEDGIVGDSLTYTKDDLTDVVVKIEKILTDIS